MSKKYLAHACAVATSLALLSSVALAESTYGYNSAGTGTVLATARVNLSLSVPKLILLKVGTAGATVDTLAWTTSYSIPATPTVPAATANSVAVTWTGAAPTVPALTNPGALAVSAWTNAATTSTVNCAMGAWVGPAGGPANVDFVVTTTGTLTHPGANLSVCAATSFAKNTVASGTWAYALGGTPVNWPAGVYTNVVTYTATGI